MNPLGKQHSSNDIQKLTIEGSHLTSQHDIASSFNKYFSSIIDNLNCNTIDKSSLKNTSTYCYLDQCNKNQNPPMVFEFFSTHEMTTIIKSLKAKNSFGHDEVSTKLIQISAFYICSPITHICNKTISSVIFPERLKYSIIKPLYKKGDKRDLSNFGPI
jgi:hypothetical protein